MSKTRKMIAGAALAAGVAGGSLAVAVASPLGLAGAQDDAQEDVREEVVPPEAGSEDGARRPGPFAGVLDELVDEGTITEEQAEAIRRRAAEKAEAFRAEHPEGRPGGGPGPGGGRGHGPMGGPGPASPPDQEEPEA